MKIAVRYYSRGGNTKKVAQVIAEATGVEANPVSEPLREDVDLLFLGYAPYAFDVDDKVKKFIDGIGVKVGKAVIFSTSAVVKSPRKYVEKPLAAKHIPLAEEEFSCRGEFKMLHKGRPNREDLKNAYDFACSCQKKG